METLEITKHFFAYGSDSFIRDIIFRKIAEFTLKNLHLELEIDRNLANHELSNLTFDDLCDKFNNKMRSANDNITIIFLICYKLDLIAKKSYNKHGYESFTEDLQIFSVRQLNFVKKLDRNDWQNYLVWELKETKTKLFDFISYGCLLFTVRNILINVLN